MIRFACARCGQSMKAPDEFVGKGGKCPKCGTMNTVPSPTLQQKLAGGRSPLPQPDGLASVPEAVQAAVPAAATTLEEATAAQAINPSHRTTTAPSRQSGNPMLLWGGLGGILVLVVVIGAWIALKRPSEKGGSAENPVGKTAQQDDAAARKLFTEDPARSFESYCAAR